MKRHYVLIAALLVAGCAEKPEPDLDIGVLWVKHSAEYAAISMQTYADARDDLPRLLADPQWSALPGQTDAADKPAAIILDVDETVATNVDFQVTLEGEYTSLKHHLWSKSYHSIPVPGVLETIALARELGITVFFLTNRPCEEVEGVPGDCPQLEATIDDIREVGIETDAEHVLLAWQRPGWSKEKLIRREFIGETHRVIALFGDDYGDFVHCTRAKPLEPCTEPATRESRHAALETYADYWGNGWYILPNPMHGSWTTVR